MKIAKELARAYFELSEKYPQDEVVAGAKLVLPEGDVLRSALKQA